MNKLAKILMEEGLLKNAERREILAAFGDSWPHRLNELKHDFMQEVVVEAVNFLMDEGVRAKFDVRGVVGEVKGKGSADSIIADDGEPVSIRYQWNDDLSIKSTMAIGRNSNSERIALTSDLTPEKVALRSMG